MLLAIDIGNTNITLGVFEDESILETFRLASDKDMPQEEYEILLHSLLKKYNITDCIIASVVDELNAAVKHACDNVFHINSFLINTKLNFGIKLKLKNPKEAGADRIANACGAYVLYSKPAIIVDLGTATTFDILDSSGDFVGGVIMPGLNLQLRALNQSTSKLPRIEAGIVNSAIGNNTADAILSGVIRGSACAIEGLIAQCEKELGEKAVIVATGGYSGLISKYMNRKFDFVNPYLTLEGLRFLYELNKNNITKEKFAKERMANIK